MSQNTPTYDELVSIDQNIDPYLIQCLINFHKYYGKRKGFNGKIIKFLLNTPYIEQKNWKYVLTLRGKLVIARKLGVQI